MTSAPQAFSPEDLLLHHHITAMDCSDARGAIVCAVTSPGGANDTYVSHLWMLGFGDTHPPRQLTNGPNQDQSPTWSPDGSTVAFLSNRSGGTPELHLIAADGGEARQLSSFGHAVSQAAWRPDGGALLVTVALPVDPDHRGARSGKLSAPRDPQAPKRVWRLPYKLDGSGYTLDREIHLFLVDAQSGDARQLTDGPFDVMSAVWSPDGRHIAWVRTRDGAPQCSDVWLMGADGTGCRRLTFDQPTAAGPSWSPDSATIVFTGACNEGDSQMRLWRIEVASGRVSPLGESSVEVVGPAAACWSSDGGSFAFVLARRGLQQIARMGVDGTLSAVAGEPRRQVSLLCGTSDWLVYTDEGPGAAEELWATDWGGRRRRPLTDFNAWWRARKPVSVERRQFVVPNGDGGTDTIDGWLMMPAGAREPVPLLVDVHGGPASYVLLGYRSHPYWQVLVSRGWGVLALNPVGSSSYGREFAARLRGRWGELDLPQHLAAIDTLRKEGVVDDRVALTGKSYGGYLTAWAIGHCDDFRCAVVSAPVTNLETHFGVSDSGFYADPYALHGEPFLNRETTRRLSPMQHVERATTPTMILQGTDDERCPKCQAEEMYVIIARAGDTPTELVLYPGGSHHFFEQGQPSQRVHAATQVVDWVTRWIGSPHPPLRGTQIAGSSVPATLPEPTKETHMASNENRNQQNQGGQNRNQQDQGGQNRNQQDQGGQNRNQQDQGGQNRNQQGGQNQNQNRDQDQR